jgi:hypothetical protein
MEAERSSEISADFYPRGLVVTSEEDNNKV